MNGVEIRGENMGILSSLYESCIHAKEAQKMVSESSDSPSDSWFGIHNLDTSYFCSRLCNTFVEEVLKPSQNTKITGFKEIRFLNKNKMWLDAYIHFLFNYFPNSFVIFYHADVEKVVKTGFWKEENYKNLLPTLRELDQWMHACHQHYPDRTLSLYDNDFIKNLNIGKTIKAFIDI